MGVCFYFNNDVCGNSRCHRSKGWLCVYIGPFESFRETVNRLEVYNWFGKEFQRNKQILTLGNLSLLVVGKFIL